MALSLGLSEKLGEEVAIVANRVEDSRACTTSASFAAVEAARRRSAARRANCLSYRRNTGTHAGTRAWRSSSVERATRLRKPAPWWYTTPP